MNTNVLKIPVIIVGSFTFSNNLIYAQEQKIDEFLKWASTDSYNYVIIAIVILISVGMLANYLWGNRKGRRYSQE